MLHTLTAETFEIDSPAEAAQEILDQLSTQPALLKHSVGIISCHPAFLESGTVKAVCDALPFPVVGATTIVSGTNREYGLELLSLCVFTADDVTFTPVLSGELDDMPGERIAEACRNVRGAAEAPSLVFTYLPFLPQLSGNSMVDGINKSLNGVPIFGTVGCDQNSDFRNTRTIFNGDAHCNRLVLVAAHGALNPQFFMVSVSEGNIQKQKGIITDAEGPMLKAVNDKTCVEYMASIGLNPNDGLEGVSSIPFIVNYRDGSPPAGRSVYTFTPEGFAICGGDMPLNGTFAVGLLDAKEIKRAGEGLFARILEKGQGHGLLVISCIGRSLALGLEPLAEVETVRRIVGDAIPMHMSYSGGEICPVYTDDGKTVNRFHNFTLIACLL